MSDTELTVSCMMGLPRRYDVTITVDGRAASRAGSQTHGIHEIFCGMPVPGKQMRLPNMPLLTLNRVIVAY
jgi:hypothetical protein